MPPCKNDPARTFKGDEPSPKGLGYCAHAEKAGAKRAGRDGRRYEVRLDKNGKKSWKAVKGLVKELAFDGASFSDGTVLDWWLTTTDWKRPGPAAAKPGSGDGEPLDAAHRGAIFSKGAVTIVLESNPCLPSTAVRLPGPVTVAAIVAAARQYFATRLTAKDYAALAEDLPNWAYPDMAELKRHVKTFADSRGDHLAYEGLRRVGASRYAIAWGS